MKTYLAEVIIRDGEHEHRCHALVEARDEEEARALAQVETIKNDGYWSYGDNLTEAILRNVKLVLPHEAQVIKSLGLAYYID